jgi:hypothetical protein
LKNPKDGISKPLLNCQCLKCGYMLVNVLQNNLERLKS